MFIAAVFVLLSIAATAQASVHAHLAAQARPLRPRVRWLFGLTSVPVALVCITLNMWLVDRFGGELLRTELFRDFAEAHWAFLFTAPLPVTVLSLIYLLLHRFDGWLAARSHRPLHPQVSWKR